MSERKANDKTVAEAIKTIEARGETVTNEKIKEITGGSLDTIMRVRRELEQKVVAAKDSPEALARFRLFYRSAYDDGYSARQPELDAFTGQVVQLIQERDADLFRLAKAMRHTSPLTTLAYLSFRQEEIDRAILRA